MSDVTLYGQISSEKIAAENQIVRDIVKEISNFGINDRQRTFLVYLLALEFEDIELLRCVTDIIKELKGKDIFLTERS